MDNNILFQTGNYSNEQNNSKEVLYSFGNYDIILKLGDDMKFYGISEIRTKKDFYSYSDLSSLNSFENFDTFYKENL